MLDNYENKQFEPEVNKKVKRSTKRKPDDLIIKDIKEPLNTYSIPSFGITVEAPSLQEAIALAENKFTKK